ncbi:MAG TPA: M24 family metallopeptidase [Candidatus Gastranaerophilaceae bacterium]|nr:M24 family metallopeptidase [Candidatus Gastranaerophilaceae bacterium]HPT40862.1 M24 family metallopeptidase [Candidatus Gastranaerophilaceae bacterium]
MQKKIIEKVRQFLKNENCAKESYDYLLVNSTNEFLVEYNELEKNSRYLITGFSGSAGEALISQKDLFLFVDSRYHLQAELEVDKNLVKVVKMKSGESFSQLICKKIKPRKTLAITAKKVSQATLEILENTLKSKNIKIKLLDFDPIEKKIKIKEPQKCTKVDKKIAGLSTDEKFKKVSKNLKKNEAILTTNLEEISYLTNLRDLSQNYSSKLKAAKCVVTKDFAILFTDYKVGKIGENFKVKKLCEFENFIKNSDQINTVFVDKRFINVYDYNLLGKKAKSLKQNPIILMKSVKTKQEIEHYKICFKKADKALFALRDYIEKNENISEYDISKKLEEEFLKNGAKSLSFKSIIAKDANSAQAHYSKNSKKEIVKEGSLILIDCGAYFEGGLATDCTRVFVKGTPSKLQKQVYTAVLKAFLKAFSLKITDKTTGFAVDKPVRKLLEKIAPKGFCFSHSLGHGIGINVHEAPPKLAFSPVAKTPLKQNMCFTIEPGLYKKGAFGVRLENSCFLDKENGKLIIKSLSNMCFEKKLIDFNSLTKTEKIILSRFEAKDAK